MILKEASTHPGLNWHADNSTPLTEPVYRPWSDQFCDLYKTARDLHSQGKLDLDDSERTIVAKLKTGVRIAKGWYLDTPEDCEVYSGKDSTSPLYVTTPGLYLKDLKAPI